jgi:hypothetical protein
MAWLGDVLEEGRHVTRLHSDLPFFAEQALKLRPKFGPLEPLYSMRRNTSCTS